MKSGDGLIILVSVLCFVVMTFLLVAETYR
jgi:hypothetical protein